MVATTDVTAGLFHQRLDFSFAQRVIVDLEVVDSPIQVRVGVLCLPDPVLIGLTQISRCKVDVIVGRDDLAVDIQRSGRALERDGNMLPSIRGQRFFSVDLLLTTRACGRDCIAQTAVARVWRQEHVGFSSCPKVEDP